MPSGAITCIFRERSLDLKVTMAAEKKLLRLHIPILGTEGTPLMAHRHAWPCMGIAFMSPLMAADGTPHPPAWPDLAGEQILAEKSSVKKRQGKLIVLLAKKDAEKGWYELRKTKGVGDSEYSKIVPDSGESVELVL